MRMKEKSKRAEPERMPPPFGIAAVGATFLSTSVVMTVTLRLLWVQYIGF